MDTPDSKQAQLKAKLEALKQTYKKKESQLKAQIRDAKARAKASEGKKDTRRKIIVGGLAIKHMMKNPNSDFAKKLMALMDEYIKRPTERKLFDMSASNDKRQA